MRGAEVVKTSLGLVGRFGRAAGHSSTDVTAVRSTLRLLHGAAGMVGGRGDCSGASCRGVGATSRWVGREWWWAIVAG